jgi:hypothetical protein
MSASGKPPVPDRLELPPLVMRGGGTLAEDYTEFNATVREAIRSIFEVFVSEGSLAAADLDPFVERTMASQRDKLDLIFRRTLTLESDLH